MRDTIELAREAWEKAGEGWVHPDWYADREKAFKEFEALVRADERTRTWRREDWTEYEHSIAAEEREACAKVCDELSPPCGYNLTETSFWDVTSLECAAAIRNRSNT